jgi:hypothetical protein
MPRPLFSLSSPDEKKIKNLKTQFRTIFANCLTKRCPGNGVGVGVLSETGVPNIRKIFSSVTYFPRHSDITFDFMWCRDEWSLFSVVGTWRGMAARYSRIFCRRFLFERGRETGRIRTFNGEINMKSSKRIAPDYIQN